MSATTITLLENAYSFINEGIRNSRRAKSESRYWSFGILHLIQGLELLMKQVLKNEHPLLIYENVDIPKNTVSVSRALERLKAISGIEIDVKEEQVIRRAISQRNKIVHHEYDSNPDHNKSVFVQLFEFVHYFYAKHLPGELHDNIEEPLWHTEAELLSQFNTEWVTYRGKNLHSTLPLDIVVAQRYVAIRQKTDSGDRLFQRSPYDGRFGADCPDCYVETGEYHVGFCDIESCPVCGEQLLLCVSSLTDCAVDYWIPRKSDELREALA